MPVPEGEVPPGMARRGILLGGLARGLHRDQFWSTARRLQDFPVAELAPLEPEREPAVEPLEDHQLLPAQRDGAGDGLLSSRDTLLRAEPRRGMAMWPTPFRGRAGSESVQGDQGPEEDVRASGNILDRGELARRMADPPAAGDEDHPGRGQPGHILGVVPGA
jgi:hypothetical protein